MDELNKKIFRSKCEEGWEWDLESLHKEEMCDYLISTGLYNKMELEYQNALIEKYNPDDIFKNRNRIIQEKIQQSEETRMTVVQEKKWYKKIFNLIKNLFHSNK